MNYILASLLLHAVLLLSFHSPDVLSQPTHIEVVEKINSAPITHTYAKPLNPRSDKPGPRKPTKPSAADMREYGNQIKALLDPVILRKSQALGLSNLSGTVSFYSKENGKITKISILRTSGNKAFDKIMVETLVEVDYIPPPPLNLVTRIEWQFTN